MTKKIKNLFIFQLIALPIVFLLPIFSGNINSQKTTSYILWLITGSVLLSFILFLLGIIYNILEKKSIFINTYKEKFSQDLYHKNKSQKKVNIYNKIILVFFFLTLSSYLVFMYHIGLSEVKSFSYFSLSIVFLLLTINFYKRKIKFKKESKEIFYDPFSVKIVKRDKKTIAKENEIIKQENLQEYDKNKFLYFIFGLRKKDFNTSDPIDLFLNYIKAGQTFLGPFIFFALVKPFFSFIPSVFLGIILNYIFFGLPIQIFRKVYNDKKKNMRTK